MKLFPLMALCPTFGPNYSFRKTVEYLNGPSFEYYIQWLIF